MGYFDKNILTGGISIIDKARHAVIFTDCNGAAVGWHEAPNFSPKKTLTRDLPGLIINNLPERVYTFFSKLHSAISILLVRSCIVIIVFCSAPNKI